MSNYITPLDKKEWEQIGIKNLISRINWMYVNRNNAVQKSFEENIYDAFQICVGITIHGFVNKNMLEDKRPDIFNENIRNLDNMVKHFGNKDWGGQVVSFEELKKMIIFIFDNYASKETKTDCASNLMDDESNLINRKDLNLNSN